MLPLKSLRFRIVLFLLAFMLTMGILLYGIPSMTNAEWVSEVGCHPKLLALNSNPYIINSKQNFSRINYIGFALAIPKGCVSKRFFFEIFLSDSGFIVVGSVSLTDSLDASFV